MNVQMIIDSASDMKAAEAAQRGLMFLPLKTRIDGEEYLDGVTITHEEFYSKLEDCRDLPTTSQLTPYDYEEACQAALKNSDEVLIITLSGLLSGTAQSAVSAARKFPGKVWVVDSENVTIGERILIEYAVQLRDRGLPAAQIAERLEKAKKRICLLALVDTLEYLVKGGRLSKTAAMVGSLLNIKPVLTLENGALSVLGKARGSKQSNNLLNETLRKKGGIDFTMPYMLAYSGMDDALLKGYIDNSRTIWEGRVSDLPVSTIGSTIGTHAGPGAIAVAFFAAEPASGEQGSESLS